MIKMKLIISTCKEKLSELEFVRPLQKIFPNSIVKKYDSFTQEDIDNADEIIISGTALYDFDYNNYLNKFKFLKTCNKKVIGICAGFQIIGKIFSCKIIEKEIIGVLNVKLTQTNQEFKAYFIHNNTLKINNEFEIIGTVNKDPCYIQHKTKNITGFAFHPEVYNEELLK